MSSKTDIVLNYANSLIGTKYKWWKVADNTLGNKGPFWASDEPLPTVCKIRSCSCSCTGLINLMRRKLGLSVPGVLLGHKYAGGISQWFLYLGDKSLNNGNGKLETFDINVKYPIGTLLIRNYRDENDQGHVAVIFSEGKTNVLYEKIIHSYSDSPFSSEDKLVEPGIAVTLLGTSHFYTADPKGYYTHACLPDDWLSE